MKHPHRIPRLCLTAFLPLLSLIMAGPGSAAVLTAIDLSSNAEETRISLQLSGHADSSHHLLPATANLPERCYVDLDATHPASALVLPQVVDNPHITAIRTGIHQTTLRTVVDLKAGHTCTIDSSVVEGHILIRVAPTEKNAAPSETTSAPPAPGAKAPENQLLFGPAPDTADALDLTGASPAATSPTTLWGRIIGFAAHDLKKDDAEDHQLLRLRSRLGLEHTSDLPDALRLQGRAAVEWDGIDYDNRQAGTSSELKLYEGFFRLNGAYWDWSVGKQRVRWGKSDQLSPLDTINPDDMRQFITLDLEDRKIPSWLTQARLHGSRFTLEAIVSPWFEESEMDYFDSDWALYRNLRQNILSNSQLPQAIRDYAASLGVNKKKPSKSLSNISGALRLHWHTDRADFAVSYRYGWETLPTIDSFPVKNIVFNGDPDSDPAEFLQSATLTSERVKASFKRQQIYGFEWETVLDQIGFRGELAYIDQVAFLTSDLTSTGKKVAHLVAGIDYTSVTQWYFNLQTSWHHIFGYNREILYFEKDNISLLGEVRKTLWRGNLEVATAYNVTLTDGSSYLQPAVTLKRITNTDIEVGAMIFSGDGDTLLGSYDEADQIYAQIRVSF